MRRTLIFLAFIVTVLIFGINLTKGEYIPSVNTQPKVSAPEVSGDNNVQGAISSVSEPLLVEIPKLGVKARIESVGQDQEGKMDVPKKAANVAWYNLGVKPGEVGNAVFAGHFDDVSGQPAVFYDLNKLQNGDEIIVTDQNQNKYRYVVTNQKLYNLNNFPLQQVFGPANTKSLNLITCDGVFNQTTKTYSQRLVIYSTLK